MDGHRLQPRKISYMDLPYDIRHEIYEQLFDKTIAIYTKHSKRPNNIATKLLCLNKQIYDEVKEFMLQRNLLFTGTSGFFVLDHFLHHLGSPALLQQLRHLTVRVPFLPENKHGRRGGQCPDTEDKLENLHAAIARSGLSDPDHVAAHASEQILTTHANTFGHAIQQLAACSGLRKLDLLLPQRFVVKNGAPYQACWMWDFFWREFMKLVPLEQHFPDEAYWAALDGLKRALPDLEISLVVVLTPSAQVLRDWSMRLHIPLLEDMLHEQDWVLCRARDLGWKVGHTDWGVDGAVDLDYTFGGEELQTVLGGL